MLIDGFNKMLFIEKGCHNHAGYFVIIAKHVAINMLNRQKKHLIESIDEHYELSAVRPRKSVLLFNSEKLAVLLVHIIRKRISNSFLKDSVTQEDFRLKSVSMEGAKRFIEYEYYIPEIPEGFYLEQYLAFLGLIYSKPSEKVSRR